MQILSGTVGEGAANARHDVALVQALLVLTKRPATVSPLATPYLTAIDGNCSGGTQAAIRQFQYDNVFVGPGGNSSQPVSDAVAGKILPGDRTWTKLTAAVPVAFANLRVLPTSKTVYIAGTTADRDASLRRVASLTFTLKFRTSVTEVVKRLYDTTGIVCNVCRAGDRRTFQTQYELLTSGRNVTHAGPGESNHNFGQAVDLGFEGLRWLRRDGTVVENEDAWMHQLDPAQSASGEALIFWNALRDAGIRVGLHRGPVSDHPHLQAWNDAGVDMADRLAHLLTSAGRMRWTGHHQRYQCDLGLGGRFFDVGSAAQIWNRQATLSEAQLTQAWAQQTARPSLSPSSASRTSTTTTAVRTPGISQTAIPARRTASPADVTAMRHAMRADFEAADAAWQSWTPQ